MFILQLFFFPITVVFKQIPNRIIILSSSVNNLIHIRNLPQCLFYFHLFY